MSGALLLLGLAISAYTIGGIFDDESDSNSSDEDPNAEDPTQLPDMATSDILISSEFEDALTASRGEDGVEDLEFLDGPLDVDTGDGDDVVVGGSGDDVIATGSGDDLASGGDGDDSVDLGDGDDTYGSAAITTLLDPDLGVTDLGDDTVFGGAGDDLISDEYGSNSLAGGSGSDFIVSTDSASEDALTPDRVDGGDEDDTIIVDQGDTVVTGSGLDTVGVLLGDEEGDVEGDELVTIEDFDIDEDTLQLGGVFDEDDLRLEVLDDGTGSTVFVNDTPVIVVIGGQNLTLNDIVIVR